MALFRTDGEFTCWRVEASRDGKDWFDASGNGHLIAEVPVAMRFKTPEDTRNARSVEPFASFSASGECWQQFGIHAAKTEDAATQFALLLSRHNPGYYFRVVLHEASQRRTERILYHPIPTVIELQFGRSRAAVPEATCSVGGRILPYEIIVDRSALLVVQHTDRGISHHATPEQPMVFFRDVGLRKDAGRTNGEDWYVSKACLAQLKGRSPPSAQ